MHVVWQYKWLFLAIFHNAPHLQVKSAFVYSSLKLLKTKIDGKKCIFNGLSGFQINYIFTTNSKTSYSGNFKALI